MKPAVEGAAVVLYCVVGSIVFQVHDPNGEVHDVALEPGDRLEVRSGIVHAAAVGPTGVECVEAGRKSA